jgi:hypothetical protein
LPLGRTRRQAEKDVAARPAAGPEPRILGNFARALAYAEGVDGGWWVGQGRGIWVGRWCRRLDFGCWGCWLGDCRPKPLAVTMALGLFTTAFHTVGGGPVALTGIPATPASCGRPALGAAVAILEMMRQEPAFTTLEEALARARMPR